MSFEGVGYLYLRRDIRDWERIKEEEETKIIPKTDSKTDAEVGVGIGESEAKDRHCSNKRGLRQEGGGVGGVVFLERLGDDECTNERRKLRNLVEGRIWTEKRVRIRVKVSERKRRGRWDGESVKKKRLTLNTVNDFFFSDISSFIII